MKRPTETNLQRNRILQAEKCVPNATYRLQLNPQFTFADAKAILKYLAALNISHIYTAPYLQPQHGSLHGYDVVDHLHINRDLGGESAQKKFCAALKKNKLSQVIDVVPNHMATSSAENFWWNNVLKHGLHSSYANYFDIYWQKSSKILIPALEADFAQVVRASKIKLQFNNEKFVLQYYEDTYPVTPDSLIDFLIKVAEYFQSKILTKIITQLRQVASFKNMPLQFSSREKYCKNADQLEKRIAALIKNSKTIQQVFTKVIAEYNRSEFLMTSLHNAQFYQLVFWQTSLNHISYRRFFHLNHLIGLRIEDPRVFAEVHKLAIKWFKSGLFNGIRVDHIDGLRNPAHYLQRLHKAFPKTWTIVEKILSSGEILPCDWPVAGTTGYEFLNEVSNVLIDTNQEYVFTSFYANYINEKKDYPTVLYEKKLLVLKELFAADINILSELLLQITRQLKCSKFTSTQITQALECLIASFPTYRTYIEDKKPISTNDKNIILAAIKRAKHLLPLINSKLWLFIRDVLLLKYSGKNMLEFVLRFQQLTGPAMAKGGEDTALYCYNRFVALNEVGGTPGKFGTSIKNFHSAMLRANLCYPHSMLTTFTHDTKRSEDVRARLFLLSETSSQWFAAVSKWTAYNEKHHAANLPDRNTLYFLYQNLVGVWPFPQERFIAYMRKAAREAKMYTSWFFPNHDYEKKLQSFIECIFADQKFCALVDAFVKPLVDPGRINSLAQTVLKLTAPGVPDIYQGSEIWNYSLVDPDNRLPIDFNLRKKLFKKMLILSPKKILQHMDTGMPKMWVTYKILELRKKYPNFFQNAEYSPVFLHGEKLQNGIAYLRAKKVLVVVPRLLLSLNNNWSNTWLEIPKGNWWNIFTNECFSGEKILVSNILKNFPVAVLLKMKNSIK